MNLDKKTLLHLKDHINCYMYSNEKPAIEYIQRTKSAPRESFISNSSILFLLKGEISLSYGRHTNKRMETGTCLLLPAHLKCILQVEKNMSAIIMQLHTRMNLCNHFPLELLYRENRISASSAETDIFFLKINKRLSDYLSLLTDTLNDGLKCNYMFELKQKEVLFYLRAYYPKKDLITFFSPILNSDINFSETVYQNVEKVKTIEELASCTNYSLSGFKKHFHKVFDMPVHQWMLREKAKKIYHEITCNNKTFKEISYEFNFSSPAHFNDFCRKQFGLVPGKIRRNVQEIVLPNQLSIKKRKKDIK